MTDIKSPLPPAELAERLSQAGKAIAAGHPEQAEAIYRELLIADQTCAPAWYGWGHLAIQMNSLAVAVQFLNEAVRHAPNEPRVIHDLAVLLAQTGETDRALAAFGHAISLAPGEARLHANLGGLLRSQGKVAEAFESLERAVALDPAHLHAREHLLALAADCADFERFDRHVAELRSLIAGTSLPLERIDALTNLLYLHVIRDLPQPIPAVVRGALGYRLGQLAAGAVKPAAKAITPPARIRIGYLSAHFGRHPVGEALAPILAAHDRSRFEIHLFSLIDRTGDGAMHQMLRSTAEQWHDLAGQGPAQAAERIRLAGIDILVDLTGTMRPEPAWILALRPAPTQVFWLGHAGAPGIGGHDYVLGDADVTAGGEELQPALVTLPAYHPASRLPPAPRPARSTAGLPEQGAVFAALHAVNKIEPGVLASWARILHAVPASVLWLAEPARPEARPALTQAFATLGISAERLVFAPHLPEKAAHLGRLGLATVMLDSFIHSAATTAIDALNAGVPVVTLAGNRWASRIAAGLLRRAGLDDLVAADIAGYERLAIQLASDPAAHAEMVTRLTAGMPGLTDNGTLTRNLERAFLEIARRAAAGMPPEAFSL